MNGKVTVSAERERRERLCRGCHERPGTVVVVWPEPATFVMLDHSIHYVTIERTLYWCDHCAVRSKAGL